MTFVDRLREKFEAAGHRVSPRDDVNEAAAAWFLDLKPKTLKNWRSRGEGPRYVKLGAGAFYPLEALLDYLRGQAMLSDFTLDMRRP